MAAEFEQFFKKEKDKKQSAQSWVPPEGDMLKINIDGTYATEKHNGDGVSSSEILMGILWVQVQDISHMHMMHSKLKLLHVLPVRLQNAQMWTMMKVQVETDSRLLVQAIKGRNQDMAVNGSLFKEIKFFARLNFSMFEIKYCPRSCNKVADVIMMQS
jgi:hypothetical protein